MLTGFINEAEIVPILEAFCHWTYKVTEGYLMVVDIQVVRFSVAFSKLLKLITLLSHITFSKMA